MLVLALDLATKSGVALGKAGERPHSFSERLRGPEDEPERAFKKLGIMLRDIFMVNAVDLVVVEAPMSMGGMLEQDDKSPRGFRFRSNPETILILQGLYAVTFGICGPYGIRCKKANVQTVRKHVVGAARPTDPKNAVINRLHQIGYLDRDCRDDNRADAVALHIWASDTFGKPATRDLHLFGGAA